MTTMTMTNFDTLGYAKKLEEAGFTRQQAEVQATVMREQVEAMQTVIKNYDEASRKELATKGDVQDVRLEIEKVRAELKVDIEKVRAEVQQTKYDLLKWQLGIGLAIILVMAKGFGWLGF